MEMEKAGQRERETGREECPCRRSHSFNNFTLRLRTVSGIERPRVSNRPQNIHLHTYIYTFIYIFGEIPATSFIFGAFASKVFYGKWRKTKDFHGVSLLS